MRHAERARKPSSFLKPVHYNKSYGSETPIGSIQFTAITEIMATKVRGPILSNREPLTRIYILEETRWL